MRNKSRKMPAMLKLRSYPTGNINIDVMLRFLVLIYFLNVSFFKAPILKFVF